MSFDLGKFEQLVAERKKQPRPTRAVDTLLDAHSVIVDALDANLEYRVIWSAMKEAGLDVSYPTFAKAMKEFLELAKMPSRKELKRRLREQRMKRRLPAVPERVAGEADGRIPAGANPSLASRRGLLGKAPDQAEREFLQSKLSAKK